MIWNLIQTVSNVNQKCFNILNKSPRHIYLFILLFFFFAFLHQLWPSFKQKSQSKHTIKINIKVY